MKFWNLTVRTAAVSMTCWLWGCVAFPVSSDEVISGKEVPKEHALFIERGKTTKNEIRDRLGDPTIIWDDENIFVYRWEQISTKVVFVFVAPGGVAAGGVPLSDDHALIIQFDEQDRVIRFGKTKRAPMRSFGHMLREWMDTK